MIGQRNLRFSTLVVMRMMILLFTLILAVSPALAGRDRTPPTAPVLSVAEVGSRHVTLSWTTSTDDNPYIFYQVFVNGSPSVFAGQNTSATVQGLEQSTTYVFTVRARDNGINWSPPSNAVSVTTLFVDPADDTTPPTTPGNLTGFDGGCGELYMDWTQSTDNVDPQSYILYEIYVNGSFSPGSGGLGLSGTIAYKTAEGANTFEVYAIDSAGNRSAPASITLQNMSPLCE